MDAKPLIYEKIAAIMQQLGAVPKDAKNPEQGYMYRSSDALYNRIHPLLSYHGVFAVPSVQSVEREQGQTRRGSVLYWTRVLVNYRFYTTDGSHVEVVSAGEGMDSGDKSTAKAMTSAYKTALCQLFTVPIANVDPEESSPEWFKGTSDSISMQELNALKLEWMKKHGDTKDKSQLAEKFAKWVHSVAGHKFDPVILGNWTRTLYNLCMDSLREDSDGPDQAALDGVEEDAARIRDGEPVQGRSDATQDEEGS